jgi:hypothetical protein
MTADEAFVSYNFAADASCFLVLSWPRPIQVLDLYLEYLQISNTWPTALSVGGQQKERKRLLEALKYFGLDTRESIEKEYWQQRAIRGGPWAPGEPEGMMTYCLADTDDVERLFDPLMSKAGHDNVDNLFHAFLRGRYAVAVASMVYTGIPIDGRLLVAARRHRVRIQDRLIERFDTSGVYEGGHLRRARITRLIEDSGYAQVWPRTDDGRLYAIDQKTLSRMATRAEAFAPLSKLRQYLGKMRPFDYDIGPDGRARASLFPFGTKTGRNAPSTSKYIFGSDKGFRGFIKPGPGQAVAYLDWERQEIAVAAYLSDDDALLRLAKAADPYIHLGVLFGLIPPGGTKHSHGPMRHRCKTIVLGLMYGMAPLTVARELELPESWGYGIWQRHHLEYRRYWAWADSQADWAACGQPLRTPFGHALSFSGAALVDFSVTTARNFLVQSTSAEIMRIAAILATEAGIAVCGPVHDAFMIEAPIDAIEAEVARMKGCMAWAVEIVLGPNRTIEVDHAIARHPEACTWEPSEIFDLIVSEIALTEAESEEGRAERKTV